MEQIIFYGLYPLGRVGDFESNGVFITTLIHKVDFYDRLVQVNAFYTVVRVHVSNVFAWDTQLQSGAATAVKYLVRQEQEEPAAASGFARLTGSPKIVDPKAHGQDSLPPKAFLDPFPVPPSNKDDVGDDTEKNYGNENPLLVGVNPCHRVLLALDRKLLAVLRLMADRLQIIDIQPDILPVSFWPGCVCTHGYFPWPQGWNRRFLHLTGPGF